MNAPLSPSVTSPASLAEVDTRHLDALEEEAIFILREVAAAFERPALLFSSGKDSCVVLHLAEKAFKMQREQGGFEGRLPFPLLHVDTGHNFPEVIEFRDQRVAEIGERLVVGHLEDSIKKGTIRLAHPLESRNGHQTVTLLETIEEHIFDHGAARGNIERLYALKRRTTVLRHAAGPLLEVAGKLHGGRVPEVCTGSQEYFRDVHDHLSRINGAIDTIRDTIGTAIQVNLSMVTIEESETTKRLAAWAAIFAVSTALAGIWGMNFEHMPELKWAFGYPMALAVIFCSGAVLYWRFRKTGWL